jgi:hypothetical protein
MITEHAEGPVVFTITFRCRPSWERLKTLQLAVGTLNAAPFRGFAPGQLIVDRIGARVDAGEWAVEADVCRAPVLAAAHPDAYGRSDFGALAGDDEGGADVPLVVGG